jgi:hypothetical protein
MRRCIDTDALVGREDRGDRDWRQWWRLDKAGDHQLPVEIQALI